MPSLLTGASGDAARHLRVKGLILSGGAGTRLRPITHTSAKQFVPVANKPILFFGIEDMVDAGITEIGIIVGGDPAPRSPSAVGDGSRSGVKVTYIPQDAPLGLAHCVLIAQDFLGDDDFVMYLGDNLLRQGIAEFVDAFEADRHRSAPTLDQSDPPAAQILLAHVHDPQRFGVAEIGADGEVVQSRREARQSSRRTSRSSGSTCLTRPSTRPWPAIEPSPRGELEITDAIQWLIDNGHRVRHEVVDGWWIDTGKLDPLLEGNRLVLETLDAGATVRSMPPRRSTGGWSSRRAPRSSTRPCGAPPSSASAPACVNSYVGPYTSIYFDCEIVDSEIEHSVVLEQSKVTRHPPAGRFAHREAGGGPPFDHADPTPPG